MKPWLIITAIVLLSSCQTLGELAFAGGGAAAGALISPEIAALGAIGGILVADAVIPDEEVGAVLPIGVDNPQGTTASTLHEAHELITGIGWWYLLIFVLLPFLTKKGRDWIGNFTKLHNAVSKKDMDDTAQRLNRIEEALKGKEKK